MTITAKADQPWLWGLQSAVESIFISQSKDDISHYLEYNRKIFHGMQKAGKVCFWQSCNGGQLALRESLLHGF